MPSSIPGPTSHSYFSQRLRLHYVDWGNDDAPPLLMIHGGRDHCRNWDWMAEALRDDYHIIAPDLRGHGDSQWMIGGSYTVPEFIYDIAQLIHQTGLAPLTIIGHSFGGGLALRYSGIYPENVTKVVAIEGVGRSPADLTKREAEPIHEKMATWAGSLRDLSGRTPRRYDSLETAVERMQEANPHLRPDQARHLTIHGINQNEDGTFTWKFDNYFRVFAPYGMTLADTRALWSQITCPALMIRGADSWSSDPQKDGNAASFKTAKFLNIGDASHWVHHDQLDEVLGHVRPFLAG